MPEIGETNAMIKVLLAVLWCPWIVFLISGFYLTICSAYNMAIYHPEWSDLAPHLEKYRNKEKCFFKSMLKIIIPLALVTIYAIAGMGWQ